MNVLDPKASLAPPPQGELRPIFPGTRTRAASERVFALAVTALFVGLAGFCTFHHEMWRDELDAWLVARDSSSPVALIHAIRYGGHPSLWYLLIWPLTRVTRDPAAMQALNVAIAGGTAFLVLRSAPGPRWLRILAVFGYFAVYEYGTIARNYGVSVLALVAVCCAFPLRRSRPILFGTLLGLAGHTSVHALILAVALAITVAAEALLVRERSRRVWAGLSVAALAFAVSVWQIVPPADTGYAMGWFLGFDPRKAQSTLETLASAYLPLPRPGPGYWQTHLLAEWFPGYGGGAWLVGTATAAAAAVTLARSPMAAGYFVVSTFGLLAFFYTKFLGYLRHHGFLWVALATAVWIAAERAPPPGSATTRLGRWTRALSRAGLAVLLAVHVAGAAIAVHGEWRYRFSAAKATAALMRNRDVDRLEMVGAADITTMPVVGYLDKERAYYPQGRRFGTNIVFDGARLAPWSLWFAADALSRRESAPVSVVADVDTLSRQPPPVWLWPRLADVGCERSEVVSDESYCVFVLWPSPPPR